MTYIVTVEIEVVAENEYEAKSRIGHALSYNRLMSILGHQVKLVKKGKDREIPLRKR